MGNFFSWLGSVIQTMFVPTSLPENSEEVRISRGVAWFLHGLLVVLVVVLLYFIHQWFQLQNKWLSGYSSWVRNYWLPTIFLMIYALCWLSYWLWTLLMAEPEFPLFDDIREAWDEALASLNRAGIDLREVPVFLVLGRPEGPLPAVFQASRMKWVVQNVPARSNSPLSLYATSDAVFVTCVGCSLLGGHLTLLVGELEMGGPDPGAADENLSIGGQFTLNFNRFQAGPVSDMRAIMARALREGRELTREERRQIRALIRKDRAWQPLLSNQSEVARMCDRFEYLCRLIVRDRYPYCPINGILLLLPIAATDSDQDAVDAGVCCQRDLAIAAQTLQMRCPTLAMLCDLETVSGFREFLDRFPANKRHLRIGQRCPLVPDLARAGESGVSTQSAMLDSLARWVFGAVVPGWVYRHFELEKPGKTDLEGSIEGNAQLFLFMYQMRERQRRLGRVLSQAMDIKEDEPILFGGCYLAATGSDPSHEQAFVAGVFRRLNDPQEGLDNLVSWSQNAWEEEKNYNNWASLCQMGVVVIVLVAVGAVAFWFLGDSLGTRR